MKYILSVTAVTAAAGIIEVLTSDSRSEKQIRLILSLCIISVITAPIRSFSGLPGLDIVYPEESEDKYAWDDSALREKIEENIESSIEAAVGAKFGIHRITVSIDTKSDENGSVTIEKIRIVFKDRGDWYKSSDVKKYISELMQAETEVRLNDR